MRIEELLTTCSPPAALFALAREIARFYPEMAQRRPTEHEAQILNTARAYGHAAGHFGIEGMRSLLEAVDALDQEKLHAAALLDRIWSGIPVGNEATAADRDRLDWIDLAIEQGLRFALSPALQYGKPPGRQR